ncbi:CoA transferase [Pseudomonas sp. UL073]|uniref:CoA transferase n=1 Tax=Zestomonas insulae TaxID=2809017 RepID=A0ABS2IEC3_9GAMM|nr:CoA transferase [Pseudomonas insulae]MBM7061018.1 CoA transferase [Pseudomonas insulae]
MKLGGITVLDLSTFLPGPYLTLAMADHGAQVIKVENPDGGDPGRHIGPSELGHTVFFRNLNRGKRSIALDLKTPEGREALLKLCETADVFIESFRPGVMDRLGVGYDQVKERNPAIIYCSISAYGQDGPYRDRPAHDLGVEAQAGLLSMTLGEDDRPALPGVPVADLLAGLQGLAGVLMALYRRQATGLGDYLDIGMHDAVLAGCLNILGPAMAESRQPVAKHERTTGGSAFYRTYETRDGRFIALAGQEPKFVRALLEALGRQDLIPLCERGPGPHQQPVVDVLAAHFKRLDLAYWDELLQQLNICYGVVKSLPEALDDPNIVSRQMVWRDSSGLRHIGNPIRFRNEPAQPHPEAPLLGADNERLVK